MPVSSPISTEIRADADATRRTLRFGLIPVLILLLYVAAANGLNILLIDHLIH